MNWKQHKVSMAAALVTVLGFFGFGTISDFVQNYSAWWTVFVALLMIVVGILVDWIIQLKEFSSAPPHIEKWKHPILIIDDSEVDLEIIMDCLNGYDLDVVTVKDITDYRFAESFEIIIGDIWGLGASGKNSVSVLNTIKEKYPYKIVLAMSSSPASCSGLAVDDAIISKRERKKYPDVILDKIKYYSSQLDDYKRYWELVEKSLTNKSEKEIAILKRNYYHHIINANVVK